MPAIIHASVDGEARKEPSEDESDDTIDGVDEQRELGGERGDWQRWMDHVERDEKLVPLRISRHSTRREHASAGEIDANDRSSADDSDEEQRDLASAKGVLERLALDPNIVLPQLFCMKRVTVELLGRVNDVASTIASPRRAVVALACEFFLDARDRQAHLAGVAGIQWEGCEPTWESLRFQDATAAKLSAYYSSSAANGEQRNGDDEPDSRCVSKKKQQHELMMLRLFDELNPRFPSVRSPMVDAAQWKFRSALLPPDAAPRFVGAEVPKKFRRGRFQPLLRPEQAVSVSRLHLSPRAPSPLASAVRHPLSRRFAADEDASGSAERSPKKPTSPPRYC